MILNTNVLVLDSGYNPVNVTTVKKAFSMLFREVAEVIEVIINDTKKYYTSYDIISWLEMSELKKELEESNIEFINTPSTVVCVPRIIKLLDHYNRSPFRVRLSRRNLFERDNYTCLYCGGKFSSKDLTIDHVIPRAQGGGTTWKNVATACFKCNSSKGSKTPKQADMKLLRKPYVPHIIPSFEKKIKDERYRDWEHFISTFYWEVPLQQ